MGEAQKTAEEALEECRSILQGQDELKRSMDDNLHYRRLRDTVAELQEQVDGLKAERASKLGESAGELGEGGAQAALDEASRNFEDRQRKIERHKGGMAAFKEQKKECERQLRSKDYKVRMTITVLTMTCTITVLTMTSTITVLTMTNTV